MYKIHMYNNNIAPSFLNEIFLMRDTNLNNKASNLKSVASKKNLKCNLFKGSLSYSGVIVWNSIPVIMKDSSSLHNFMNECTK